MLVKILIDIKDYDFYLPRHLPHNMLSDKMPYCRMNRVVEAFEDEGFKNRILIENYKLSDMAIDTIYTFYHSKEYFYVRDSLNNLHIYRIYYIDGKRPWTIVRSKYGERVHFFKKSDERIITEQRLNYGLPQSHWL